MGVPGGVPEAEAPAQSKERKVTPVSTLVAPAPSAASSPRVTARKASAEDGKEVEWIRPAGTTLQAAARASVARLPPPPALDAGRSNELVANAYSEIVASGTPAVTVAPEECTGPVAKLLLDAQTTAAALDAILNTAFLTTPAAEQSEEAKGATTRTAAEGGAAGARIMEAANKHILTERRVRAELLAALRRRMYESIELKKENSRLRRELDELRAQLDDEDEEEDDEP